MRAVTKVLRSQVVAGHGRASEAFPVAVRSPVLSEGGAVVVESLRQGLLRLRAVHIAEVCSGVHAQAVEAGHDARHQAQFPVACVVGVVVLVDHAVEAVHLVGIDAEHILVVPVSAFGHELQRHLLEGLGGQGLQRLVNHLFVAEKRVFPSVAHDEERRIGVVHIEPSVRRALHHGHLVEYLVQVHRFPVGVLRQVVDDFGRRDIDEGFDKHFIQRDGFFHHRVGFDLHRFLWVFQYYGIFQSILISHAGNHYAIRACGQLVGEPSFFVGDGIKVGQHKCRS